MRTIKCRECATVRSDDGPTCLKCGAPIPKKQRVKSPPAIWVIVGAIIALGGIIAIPLSINSKVDSTSRVAASILCAKNDLICLGNRGVASAGTYCVAPIERLVGNTLRWTDSTSGVKFTHYRWKNSDTGSVTYIGDRAEYQNSFGALTPMIYECDMERDSKTVTDVRANEGRLPAPIQKTGQ